MLYSRALFLCTLTLVVHQGRGTIASDEAAVRSARQEQNAAIKARNIDSVASYWVDDVNVTAGLGFTLRGKDTYRHAFMADSSIVYERKTTSVQVSEARPLAWEDGTWTGRQVGETNSPLLEGRYAAQWVKAGGRWLIRSEVFVALKCSGVGCSWPITLR